MIISTTPELDDPVSEGELVPDLEVRRLDFSLVEPGSRLDVALVALVPEFSRSYLQQLVQSGAVSVNGKCISKTAQKTKVSDRGSIELRPTPQSQAFRAEAIPLEIVFSDEHLLVINKAAGMVVHPAPGNWSGTVMNALLGMDARAFNLPRAGIVHRLDKDTSGLVLVANAVTPGSGERNGPCHCRTTGQAAIPGTRPQPLVGPTSMQCGRTHWA